MRVYLPSTLPALADVLHEGAVGPAPVHGFAVTPALRESYACATRIMQKPARIADE